MQLVEWAQKPFHFNQSTYSALYFTVTGLPYGARRGRPVILVVLLVWDRLGYFDADAITAGRHWRDLLAFRRCGLARGLLHHLRHATSGGAMRRLLRFLLLLPAARAPAANNTRHPSADVGRRRRIDHQARLRLVPHTFRASSMLMAWSGPPLDHIASRQFIAGVLRNTPDNMVHWLRFPQQIVPGQRHARSWRSRRRTRGKLTAYLETLK